MFFSGVSMIIIFIEVKEFVIVFLYAVSSDVLVEIDFFYDVYLDV